MPTVNNLRIEPGTGQIVAKVVNTAPGLEHKSGNQNVISPARGGCDNNLIIIGDATGRENNGVLELILANTGITSGQYTKLVVNNKGLVIAGSSLSEADIATILGITPIGISYPVAQDFLRGSMTTADGLPLTTAAGIQLEITGDIDYLMTSSGDTITTYSGLLLQDS